MTIQQILKRGIANPQKIFVLDGFGAILSAILLGVVLVRLESVFGIPRQTLYLLVALPCVFAVYDFYCFYKIKKNTGAFLRGIAIRKPAVLFAVAGPSGSPQRCSHNVGLGLHYNRNFDCMRARMA